MWSPMRSPTLPVQVEEELQRVARKRSATADVACRELLEPLSHDQSLRALSEAGNSETPLQQLAPLLRSVIQSLFGARCLAPPPCASPGQDPGVVVSGVTSKFAQLGLHKQHQQQPSFVEPMPAVTKTGPAAAKLTPDVSRALQQVCDKKGVKADDSCVEQLAALAPEDALEVLRAIGSTGSTIRSLSPYLAAVIKSKLGGGGGTPEKKRTPMRAGGEPTTPPSYEPASSWSQPLSPPAHRFESDEHVQVSPCASPSQAHVKEARIPLPQRVQIAVDYLCCSRKQQLNAYVLEQFTQFEEEDSLYILALVDERREIHNLSAFTSSVLKQELPSPSSAACDVNKLDEDVWFDPELQLDAHAWHPPDVQARMPPNQEVEGLAHLEFKKRSLILQLTGNSPEYKKLLTARDLEEFQNVPVEKEKSFLNSLAAQKNIPLPADMWSRNESEFSIHECRIHPNGHCSYQGRTPVPAETALLRTLGDRLLLVRFDDLIGSSADLTLYRKVLEEGIVLGFRHYQYFNLEAVIPATGRRNILIFSTKGPLSAPEEVANSDLDGDLYWVCINPELTKYVQPHEAYRRKEGVKSQGKRPADMSSSELERSLHNEFLKTRFQSSSMIGLLCWHHNAHMDRFLTLTDQQLKEKQRIESVLYKIVDCHQDAVDSGKTGMQPKFPNGINVEQLPHYLENKSGKSTYRSTSVIGQLYDLIDAPISAISNSNSSVTVDPDFEYGDFKKYMERWRLHFQSYLPEMKQILNSNSLTIDNDCECLFRRYRKLLYGAETLKEMTKSLYVVLSEASAIYQVVYCRAMLLDIKKQRAGDTSGRRDAPTKFAWGVAIQALCVIYADKQPGQPIVHACTPIRQKIVLDD